MAFCLEEQGFNSHSLELSEITEEIVKKEKGEFEIISWDDFIKALHKFYEKRALLRLKMKEKIEIEAEEGEDFQEYVYADGKSVPFGEVIGYEYKDENGVWQIELKDGIYYP